MLTRFRPSVPSICRLVLILSAVFAAPGVIFGEAAGADPPASAPDARFFAARDSLRVYETDTVVVERTRARRGVSPVPFSDVSREEISRVYFGQDVPMVLTALPSVYAYSDAGNGFGYSYIKIRGFDQNRLSVMLNGVPLNDPEAHQVYWVDHADILADAKSVQVQRGVGATLFGGTSFGGSVNVLTSPFSSEPGLHLTTGYGNYTDGDLNRPLRTYRAAFSTGLLRDGTTALHARYSRQESEGYRDASGADLESFGLSAIYAGGFGGHKVDVFSGKEVTHFAWDGVSPDFGVDLDDREARRFNYYGIYPNNVDDFHQVIGSVTSEFKLAPDVKLTNTAYYVNGEGFFEQFETGEDLYDYGIDPIVVDDSTTIEETDLVRRRWLDNYYWGLLPQITTHLGDGRLMLGTGFRYYEAGHFGELVWTDADLPAAPLERYYDYDTRKISFEGYGELQYPVLARAIASLGIQYQGHRYRFRQVPVGNFLGYEFDVNHDFVNPRAGVRYEVARDASVYASVAYAQREPSDADYIDGDDPSFVPAFRDAGKIKGLDDPIVKPEKVIDFEVGAEIARERWTARVGLYHLDFRDELIPIDGGRIEEEGRLARANAERTVHQGVEVEGELRAAESFTLQGNVSLARHHFVDHEIAAYWVDDPSGLLTLDDKTIPRSPEVLGNLIAEYRRGPLTLGSRIGVIGKQYIEGENIERLAIDPHAVVDVSASYDLARHLGAPRRLVVQARVLNLLDSLYETWGYSYYDADEAGRLVPFSFYWPGPTRSFIVSVETTL
jgi:iron complex outermembrane receptor protein